jgi:CO dehydrogenase maturation factor
MTRTIALAGKGGVGKTTVAALVIKYLMQQEVGSILAIDADPSSNLNIVLGMPMEWTVGDIREDMLGQVKTSLAQGGAAMGSMPGGVSKRDYLEYQMHSAMTEGNRCDLIAMGRGEGSGCYCAVNHNLREVLDSISRHYAYVVIDNEAGMEHLARRTTRDVQDLLIVSDATPRGLIAAQRISEMAHDLEINVEKSWLLLNRASEPLPAEATALIAQIGSPLLGIIPTDSALAQLDARGLPLLGISCESAAYRAASVLMQKALPA